MNFLLPIQSLILLFATSSLNIWIESVMALRLKMKRRNLFLAHFPFKRKSLGYPLEAKVMSEVVKNGQGPLFVWDSLGQANPFLHSTISCRNIQCAFRGTGRGHHRAPTAYTGTIEKCQFFKEMWAIRKKGQRQHQGSSDGMRQSLNLCCCLNQGHRQSMSPLAGWGNTLPSWAFTMVSVR